MLSQDKMAIESLYNSKCDVFETTKVKRTNGSTAFENVKKHSDLPCRVSFKGISTSNQTETTATANQVIKLFVSNEFEIIKGSKITVTNLQTGKISHYKASGEPVTRSVFQEILLEIEDKYV